MSVRTMSLVFEYDMPDLETDDGRAVPDSTAKFVLLALADHASDDGEGAYIGVKRICKKTSMSSQTVCNALNALRYNGYTTYVGISKVDTNNYTINIQKLFQPVGFQRLESDDSSGQNPGIPAARVKPSVNHQVNHNDEDDPIYPAPLIRIYEREIGAITPFIADSIEAWMKEGVPAKWIADGMHEPAAQNKRSWKYCEAIIKRWNAQGNQNPVERQKPGKPVAASLESAFEAIDRVLGVANG